MGRLNHILLLSYARKTDKPLNIQTGAAIVDECTPVSIGILTQRGRNEMAANFKRLDIFSSQKNAVLWF